MKFPKESGNCEDMFMDSNDFEQMCGRRNAFGDWVLCDACRDENVEFLEEYDKKRDVNAVEGESDE